MSDGELLDAREAMSLLGINESELQTMVARGDLRAFRSAGTMKFRRDDVVGIKSEKKTEPTIIMPPAQAKSKPGSGILPTVSSAKSPRGSSKNLPAIKTGSGASTKATLPLKPAPAPTPAAETGTSTDQIILEEFELAPAEDDGTNTQAVTAQQTAVNSGNVTIVDPGIETGNVTVIEQGVSDLDANATASAIAPIAVTSSGRAKKPSDRVATKDAGPSVSNANAPAMSRVRAAVGTSSQSAAQKRAQASVTSKPAGPIITGVLILTAFLSLLSTTIIGVQMFKGNYDKTTHQRIIPPFLDNSPIMSYRTSYANMPGTPDDTDGDYKRPQSEFPEYKR